MARKLGATVIGHTPALRVIEEAAAWSGGVLQRQRRPADGVPRLDRRRVRHGRQAGDLRGRHAGAEGARHAGEGRRARSHLVGGHAAVLQGDLDGRLERVRVRGGRRRAQARHRALPRSRVDAAGSTSPGCSRTRSPSTTGATRSRRSRPRTTPARSRSRSTSVADMADSESDVVLVDIADRVAVITINRPEQRNALNRARAQGAAGRDHALRRRRRRRRDDPHRRRSRVLRRRRPEGVRLGCRCSKAKGFAEVGERGDDGRTPFRGALPPHAKPLIGAVNGVAVTGGFEVALNCDFLIASERARFADTHARVGVMPGWGLTVLLAQRIGVGRAKEMSITGNYVDAPHRARVGARQPRRAARRAAAVLPAARGRRGVERPARRAAHDPDLQRGHRHRRSTRAGRSRRG